MNDSSAGISSAVAEKGGWRRISGPPFRKYVALFLAVVCVALITNGAFEVWFSYQEHKASLIRIQREQAEAASAKIGQFIREIESQVGWTTQLPWSAGTIEQRRFDALRLLRQVPAITELAQLDAKGHERLRVSRLAMDVVDNQNDFSKDPKFADAVEHKVYYGPVYFRRESEPYMTLSLAGTRRDAGVSVAEVNLKFIWDVVSQIKVGERGHAYVIDAQGRLIAHPTSASCCAIPTCRRSCRCGRRALAPPSRCRKPVTSRAATCSPPTRRWRRSDGSYSSNCRSPRLTRRSMSRSSARACCCWPDLRSPRSLACSLLAGW